MKLKKSPGAFSYLDFLILIGLPNCWASASTSPRFASRYLPNRKISLISADPAKMDPWRFPSHFLLLKQLICNKSDFLAK